MVVQRGQTECQHIFTRVSPEGTSMSTHFHKGQYIIFTSVSIQFQGQPILVQLTVFRVNPYKCSNYQPHTCICKCQPTQIQLRDQTIQVQQLLKGHHLNHFPLHMGQRVFWIINLQIPFIPLRYACNYQ